MSQRAYTTYAHKVGLQAEESTIEMIRRQCNARSKGGAIDAALEWLVASPDAMRAFGQWAAQAEVR